MEKKQVLRVRMFGNERITYGDTLILVGKNSMTKTLKMLLILLHSGKKGILRNKLLEDLFGRDELSNASSNLRVTTHRLKKMLIEAGLPEYEYIVSRGGIYRWESPMETEIDVFVFKELLEEAKAEQNTEKKMEKMKNACKMYGGEFLQRLSGDEWVLLESVQYKKLYTDALKAVCTYLMEQREYQEVLQLTETACEIYPFDEWQSVKIDCLIAMNRYKEALKEYEDTAKMLTEELGVMPSETMMKQFRIMSSRISNRPQIIDEIKKSLQEDSQEEGAFFCTLPGFRDAYRMIYRGMERSGQSAFLLVCSLVDSHGRPMEASDKLEEMSETLFQALKSALRRCDSFTKYNQSQFLVLLLGINEENCQVVINRISSNFSREHRSWTQRLVCNVASLYDVDNQEEKISFGGGLH